MFLAVYVVVHQDADKDSTDSPCTHHAHARALTMRAPVHTTCHHKPYQQKHNVTSSRGTTEIN
eukprot:13390211-Alexandrium_andersonii.AAC.1